TQNPNSHPDPKSQTAPPTFLFLNHIQLSMNPRKFLAFFNPIRQPRGARPFGVERFIGTQTQPVNTTSIKNNKMRKKLLKAPKNTLKLHQNTPLTTIDIHTRTKQENPQKHNTK
ncbi:hypothetical protein, partial [Polycladidibacter stylochi]|uniref:hypothetical protein n=1 Tax=Polycladidibacter stylochi TaxID=1807766 RepID=UPI0019D36381